MHLFAAVSTAMSDGLLDVESMLLVNKDQRYCSRYAEAAYCRLSNVRAWLGTLQRTVCNMPWAHAATRLSTWELGGSSVRCKALGASNTRSSIFSKQKRPRARVALEARTCCAPDLGTKLSDDLGCII